LRALCAAHTGGWDLGTRPVTRRRRIACRRSARRRRRTSSRCPASRGATSSSASTPSDSSGFDEDIDAAPLFRGLPDDRCQSPHWGVVVKGSITFRSADGEETIGAGEVYYAPPGHTPVLTAGTELIEFSPTEALQQTMEVVGRNAAAMSA
jgi:hypothetical protein